MSKEQDKIDRIVSMLDNFVNDGGGHMNIQIDNPNDLDNIKVETFKSSDCNALHMACEVPTLQDCIDFDYDLDSNKFKGL